MNKLMLNKKELLQHAVAVVLMIAACVLYCSPVLEGKRIVQDDIVKNEAQKKETVDFREETGSEPLWTSRVFSGMTTFNIGTRFTTNGMMYLDSVLRKWLPPTVNIMFVTMIGFYILLLVMGVNPWLALCGAIGYGLSSNLLVSLMAGHNTKILTLGYMGIALAGLFLIFNSKKYLGAFLASLGTGLMLYGNHFQIIYYFIILSFIIGIVQLVHAVKEKTLADFWKSAALLLIAGIIGAMPAAGKAYNVYAHSDPTIRGGNSELSTKKEEDKGGLDREYAMRWSNGISETMTIVIPSFMGGSTAAPLPEGGAVEEALGQFQLNKQQKEQILSRAPMYVGDQPFLLGTVYFGAAFIFLFILSMFIIKGKTRIWIASGIIFFLVISWGRHAEVITGLLFDYLPLYNKFRTPSMALAIPGLLIPFAAILGLQRVRNGEIDKAELQKAFKYTIYVSGGLMVLLLLYGLTNDWIGPKDAQIQKQGSAFGVEAVYEALLADRKSRYISDWVISLVMMAGAAAVVWFGSRKKLSLPITVVVLLALLAGDNWRVSKRYLNDKDFDSKREFEARFKATPADQAILKDNDPHYRVINLSVNPWTDGFTSYYHKNIGGHHAAKLQRYQELIEMQLSPQLQKYQKALRQAGDAILVDPQLGNTFPVLNMLNMKYTIIQPNNPKGVAMNPAACGNAWFVKNIKQVSSADEEVNSLSDFNPLETAVVHSEYSDDLYTYAFGKATSSTIELTEFKPNHLTYKVNTELDGLAVFSEVFYENGWEAYIDGKPAEIYRVNYVLRAMKIPAMSSKVEMVFNPSSYAAGQGISLAGTVLFLLFTGGMIFLNRKKTQD